MYVFKKLILIIIIHYTHVYPTVYNISHSPWILFQPHFSFSVFLLFCSPQSPFGTPMLLRQTRTCPQAGWGFVTHQALTTGISLQAPPSGSLHLPLVKLLTQSCPPLCPWRQLLVRSPRWVLTTLLVKHTLVCEPLCINDLYFFYV